jgi:hypothetical protein
MFEGLDNLRRCTKDFLFMQRVTNIKVSNPFLVFGASSGRSVCPLTISAVRDIWGDDPIHPDIDCLDKLADFITNEVISSDQSCTGAASECGSSTIINCQQPPQAKRIKWASEAPDNFVTPSRDGPPRGRGQVRGRGRWSRWQRRGRY